MLKKLRKIYFNILSIIGILIILYVIMMATMSNFNTGIVIVLIIGLLLTFSKLISSKLASMKRKWLANCIKIVMVIAVIVTISIVSMLIWVGSHDTTTFDEDAIIVLGAGIRGETVSLTLKHRLDKSIEYWNINPDAIIIVTGGQGPQEDITEALAMQRYLVERNIPSEKIILEEKATSTRENFVNSKEILDNKFAEGYTSVFITNTFHVYRAGKIAQLAEVDSNSFAAITEWYTTPVVYTREVFVVIKSWVIGY